ncbi:MAG: GNAT family N-acetyltransferase [Acidimicrobiia bacterium]
MSSVDIERMHRWPDSDLAALRDLSSAVYPPGEADSWPGRAIRWATPEWGVKVIDDEGRLICYAGLLMRNASHDGLPVRIGGVGGVKTHPLHRGAGHASAAMRQAQRFFAEDGEVDFGLLVCDDSLIPYYERLGWEVFVGDMLTEQPEGTVRFTFNRVMVLPVARPAPHRGVIDLKGPPW